MDPARRPNAQLCVVVLGLVVAFLLVVGAPLIAWSIVAMAMVNVVGLVLLHGRR
jgi:hypothetical protein